MRAGPLPRAHQRIALCHPPHHGQKQSDRVVGDVFGVHSRGVGHGYPPRAGVGHVHRLVTRADTGDQAEVRQAFNHGGIERLAAADDYPHPLPRPSQKRGAVRLVPEGQHLVLGAQHPLQRGEGRAVEEDDGLCGRVGHGEGSLAGR